MQITLTQAEVETAIAKYLRANAAVNVGAIKFSQKKCGLETTVETTVIDIEPPPIVEPIIMADYVVEGEDDFEPEDSKEFEEQKELPIFEQKPEELLEEETKVETPQPEESVVSEAEIEQAIAAVEEASNGDNEVPFELGNDRYTSEASDEEGWSFTVEQPANQDEEISGSSGSASESTSGDTIPNTQPSLSISELLGTS